MSSEKFMPIGMMCVASSAVGHYSKFDCVTAPSACQCYQLGLFSHFGIQNPANFNKIYFGLIGKVSLHVLKLRHLRKLQYFMVQQIVEKFTLSSSVAPEHARA